MTALSLTVITSLAVAALWAWWMLPRGEYRLPTAAPVEREHVTNCAPNNMSYSCRRQRGEV